MSIKTLEIKKWVISPYLREDVLLAIYLLLQHVILLCLALEL